MYNFKISIVNKKFQNYTYHDSFWFITKYTIQFQMHKSINKLPISSFDY